jgi:hypothetical protein
VFIQLFNFTRISPICQDKEKSASKEKTVQSSQSSRCFQRPERIALNLLALLFLFTFLIVDFMDLEKDELPRLFGGYEKADGLDLSGETDVLVSRNIVMALASRKRIMYRQPDSATSAVHCFSASSRQPRIGAHNGLAEAHPPDLAGLLPKQRAGLLIDRDNPGIIVKHEDRDRQQIEEIGETPRTFRGKEVILALQADAMGNQPVWLSGIS